MTQVGILRKDDRVELLEGEIVEMAPIGPPHAACVNRLVRLFTALLGDRVIVSVQNPVRLDERSEPQPDVALLKPQAGFYATRHPEPDDVLLLVEVSSSTAPFDRLVKLPLYAEAGIRQAWLVDLDEGVVEVHRQAAGLSYGEVEVARGNDHIRIDAFAGLSVIAAEILG